MSKKILLINAINQYVSVERQYPPLGLGYLVSSLKKHFGVNMFKFKIIDKDVENELLRFKPDIVGISSVTQNFNIAKRYARLAKKRNIPVIIGGVHITMLSQSLSSDMDIGVIGEGEETIVDIMKIFDESGKLNETNLGSIPGIVYWKDDKICYTGPRQPIFPLDKLPLPERSLLDVEETTYMFSSRGCPYRCTFCASARFWNNLRFFSAEYVVDEIMHLVNKYGVKRISFYDDLFIANKQRLKEIVALLKKKGLPEDVSFYCSCRANLVTEEVASLLKDMNFKSVSMGLESGCDKTLKYLKGDNISVKDNINAVRILKKQGISVNASFVIGSPGETKSEILKTLKFIKDNKIDNAGTFVLTPFPGTPIWDYAKGKGIVSDDMDWDKLNIDFKSNYKKAITVSDKLSKRELYGLLSKFERHQRYLLFKQALKNPLSKDVRRFVIRKSIELAHSAIKQVKTNK